jgi:hypothetical protein
LETLRETCDVSKSAAAAGIHRMTAYAHRKTDPEFAQAWEDGKEMALDRMEEEALRRGYEGVDEPVFFQGKQVSTIRKYSDTLLIFYLKGNRPEKYRENLNLSGKVDLFAGRDIDELISIAQRGLDKCKPEAGE